MMRTLIMLGLVVIACTGCEVEISLAPAVPHVAGPHAPLTPATNRPIEIPVCNLALPLRVKNYSGGSCVHASTGSAFNWLNLFELQRFWNKTYHGGESYNGLTSKLRRNNIPFYDTAAGDEAVLERCTRERRMATIFYYSNHSVSFNGFGDEAVNVQGGSSPTWNEYGDVKFCRGWGYYRNAKGKFAYLLDNNRTGAFIQIPREEFLRKWRGYDGVAIVPTVGAPRPPLPYIARH